MKYDDIIHLSRPQPTDYTPMPILDRAAQFMPFAALSGHAEGTAEVARTTEQRMELSEDAIAHLNNQLAILENLKGEQPEISMTYFIPDALKSGGRYTTIVGTLKRIDDYTQSIILYQGTQIPICDITDIQIEAKATVEV